MKIFRAFFVLEYKILLLFTVFLFFGEESILILNICFLLENTYIPIILTYPSPKGNEKRYFSELSFFLKIQIFQLFCFPSRNFKYANFKRFFFHQKK